MEQDRISYFENMLADNPDEPTGLLALANEYRKANRLQDEAATLNHYLGKHEDEGNAYQRLAETLTALGRQQEARITYEKGIEQARKFGHDGMAQDMKEALEDLD